MLFHIKNECSLSFFFLLLLTIHQHFLQLHWYLQCFKIKHIHFHQKTYHEFSFHYQFLIFKYLQNIFLNEVELSLDLLFLKEFRVIHHQKGNKILENQFFFLLNKNLNLFNILLKKHDILLKYPTFFYFLYIQLLLDFN